MIDDKKFYKDIFNELVDNCKRDCTKCDINECLIFIRKKLALLFDYVIKLQNETNTIYKKIKKKIKNTNKLPEHIKEYYS